MKKFKFSVEISFRQEKPKLAKVVSKVQIRNGKNEFVIGYTKKN